MHALLGFEMANKMQSVAGNVPKVRAAATVKESLRVQCLTRSWPGRFVKKGFHAHGFGCQAGRTFLGMRAWDGRATGKRAVWKSHDAHDGKKRAVCFP